MNNQNFEQVNRQAFNLRDASYRGSTFEEVKEAIFENPYYQTWKGEREASLPVYRVTLLSVLRGLFSRAKFPFRSAAERTIDSKADLRWGPDTKGQRRLLHPNGVCLTGIWEVDAEETNNAYTGYFRPGSKGRVIARYSTCCTETRKNRNRSLSLVGKIYPEETKLDEESGKEQLTIPANFISQEDLGGSRSSCINEVATTNAPNTTFWKRGYGFLVLFLTGLVFKFTDREITIRQLYEIAELGIGKEDSIAPKFIRFSVAESQPKIETHDDFRDEVMAHIFDQGDPESKRTLVFDIEVSDQGNTFGPSFLQRRRIRNWRRIGKMTFDNAVVSYNGDFVIHFHHPAWRTDRNDAATHTRSERT